MKNYVQPGDYLTITAGAPITSGSGVLTGAMFGIAATDAANGEEVELAMTGVFDLPKTASQAWTVGAPIYWDASEAECTTTSTDNTLIGLAVLAVGSGADETTGRVRLCPGIGA
jgi:predicted RecA/RadA family phage recombinase